MRTHMGYTHIDIQGRRYMMTLTHAAFRATKQMTDWSPVHS